ncbi:hypothetical protein GCM10009795_026370 [Nocardioides hankookensis]|uniref:Uncharacterized protein n=1 Tax=Nocardioides hankookensis TaxID=443157 RepID=A0ABW1LEV7_9ACTN
MRTLRRPGRARRRRSAFDDFTLLRSSAAEVAINLEDTAAPRCFEIEPRLRESLDIPVFHDDQHGW